MLDKSVGRFFSQILILIAVLLISGLSMAAQRLSPFLVASEVTGQDLVSVIHSTKKHLTDSGFEIVGEYTPYAKAHVIVVSSPALLELAKDERNASYMAALRVGVTEVDGKIQITYNNPEYLKYAYQVDGDVSGIADAISDALGGQVKPFGSKRGLTPRKLKKYQYTYGMEYFDEELELAEYRNHSDANIAVNYNINARKGGVYPVYKLDIPGTDRTLYGVGMTDGYSSDEKIMGLIDFGAIRHTAHLPYEILVDGAKVFALHPRFRIAIDFPDLRMVGEQSFYSIMSSPVEINKALVEGVGGTWSLDSALDAEGFF